MLFQPLQLSGFFVYFEDEFFVKNAEKNCDLCSNAALTKGWCSTSAAI
ncbi:hypothetical protein VAA_01181 [Vibrio anguillarum 775]|nr:hypothetical protein VAA_01181 [Vibrio anguillarum 775]